MGIHAYVATTTLATVLLIPSLGCNRKASQAVIQAQEAAKAADERVANLEKEIADIKAAKGPAAADPETVAGVSKAQLKGLDRRLADAKKNATQRHEEAKVIETAPKAEVAQTIVVEVPAQTPLPVNLARDLATDRDQAGDAWEGTLAEDVVVGGRMVWPRGTAVKGVVTQSAPAGRLQGGQGGLGIRLSTVGRTDVEAGTYLVVGDKRGERNAKYIGGTAALGALVGILTSKNHQGDHALGGAALGAAAGTAMAAGTAETVVRIPATKTVVFTLASPERVILK